MTKLIGNIVLIGEEEPQQCDLCGIIAELRPYGPKGEAICFDCGEANEPTTSRIMQKALHGIAIWDIPGEKS